MTDTPRYWTPEQVAELFQIHPETVRQNARTRKWPHVKLGPRTTRFTDQHIQAITEQHDQQPQAARPSRRRRSTS